MVIVCDCLCLLLRCARMCDSFVRAFGGCWGVGWELNEPTYLPTF